jgi:hypothetical protein
MKKNITLFITVLIMLALSSCGIHSTLSSNQNQNQTQVVLARKNYKIIQKVTGSATNTSIFGIGGGMRALVSRARAKMLDNIDFAGSRAIINENIETNDRIIFFVNTKTVTVSAYLIEFTE